jgi:hypothetical protein
MGIEPITTAAAITAGAALLSAGIGTGAKIYASAEEQEDLEKALAKKRRAQRKADLEAARRAAEEDARMIQQGRYSEALGRRQTTP